MLAIPLPQLKRQLEELLLDLQHLVTALQQLRDLLPEHSDKRVTVLTLLGQIGPLSLLACTLAVGCGTALNGPAWQASVRMQVGPADLPQAISLNTIAFNLARSVGPALSMAGSLRSVNWPGTACQCCGRSVEAMESGSVVEGSEAE